MPAIRYQGDRDRRMTTSMRARSNSYTTGSRLPSKTLSEKDKTTKRDHFLGLKGCG